MATWKCDIKKQYGKFSGFAWKATEKQGNAVAENVETQSAIIDAVVGNIKKSGFVAGDEVIFRDAAYASLGELKGVMSRSPY